MGYELKLQKPFAETTTSTNTSPIYNISKHGFIKGGLGPHPLLHYMFTLVPRSELTLSRLFTHQR